MLCCYGHGISRAHQPWPEITLESAKLNDLPIDDMFRISAYYTQSNDLVPVVQVVASEEWQSIYSKILRIHYIRRE